jgi:hypothetical protein
MSESATINNPYPFPDPSTSFPKLAASLSEFTRKPLPSLCPHHLLFSQAVPQPTIV